MNTLKLVRSLLTAALVLTVASAHAQNAAPVPTPKMITSAPYTITTAGYYQLGADIVYTGDGSANNAIITIAANNVILDFGGHFISGTSNVATQLYGVYANEHSNLTIKNGTIGHCFIGVYLLGNGQTGSLNINQSVHDMLITNCYYSGSLFDGATNSQVSTCRISNIGGTTVSLFTISGSTYQIQGFSYGLFFSAGAGNAAANNTVTNLTASNENFGIADYNGTELLVSGNTISKLTSTGIGIYEGAFAVNNTVSSSTFGIYQTTKYANNLTSGSTTPFTGGTADGYND